VDLSYGSLEGYFANGLRLRASEREHLRNTYGGTASAAMRA
jgi:hypothetical protein